MGHYEIKPPIYKKFIEKNICILINGKLEINSLWAQIDAHIGC